MRIRSILVTLTVAALVPMGTATATASAAAPAAGTRANLLDAMHGEAMAFARYTAYADQADRDARPGVAALLRTVAAQERGEHFVEEAGFVALVGDEADNLREAIRAELAEARDLYPGFAKQAAIDGDRVAATLFDELASDEATHRQILRKALDNLDCRCHFPPPPTVDVVAIVPGPAKSRGRTLDNVRTALVGEAFASAKYRMYARAEGEANRALGQLWAALSDVERLEHFAALANLAGLVGEVAANLTTAIAGENQEATVMYPTYAAAAVAAGDTEVGALFTEIAGDEAGHRDAFRAALGGS
jgi:rubrerythrin